jgi:transcriptional regulator GlxA family with amidase domain
MEENMYIIKLSQLAKISNISTRHFNRLFRNIYKTSPLKYHLKIRLEKACRLLADDKYSITEIALICGFSDSSHFSKAFKNAFEITPLQYRKKRV